MPSVISPHAVAKAHADHVEMLHLFSSTSLNLQSLIIDGYSILCDTLTGTVGSYLPVTLCKTAFDILHNTTIGPTQVLKLRYALWRRDSSRITWWSKQCQPCHHHNYSVLGYNANDMVERFHRTLKAAHVQSNRIIDSAFTNREHYTIWKYLNLNFLCYKKSGFWFIQFRNLSVCGASPCTTR